MSDSHQLRRSDRSNIGQPPDRLGYRNDGNEVIRQPNTTDDQQRDTNPGVQITSDENRDSSHRSHSSHHTGSRLNIDEELQFVEQIATLEDKIDSRSRSMKLMEFEVNTYRRQLEKTELQLLEQMSDEEKSNLLAKKSELQQEIEEVCNKIELEKIELEFQERHLQRTKTVIVEKRRILEGSEEGESVSKDHENRIREWTEIQRLLNVNTGNEELQNDNNIPLTDEEEEMRRRFDYLRNGHSSNFNPNPPPVNQSSSNPIDQIAGILAQALNRAVPTGNPSSTTETRTILARQVQGKELPVFTGKPEDWPGFICAYENSTANCHYTDSDNLIRLQKCLKGEAYRTVQCLLIKSDSVPEAIQQLKMRFGRPEHIVDSMVIKARESPALRSDKPETFIEFGIAITNLKAMIIALGCNDHLNNPVLLNELIKKLPVSDQRQWISWLELDPSRKKNLSFFAEWMKMQTDNLCSLFPHKPKPDEKQEKSKRQQDRVLSVNDESEKNGKKKSSSDHQCAFCNGKGHRIQNCRSFPKQKDDIKQKTVREKRLCFGCLNVGHGFSQCRSKKKCKEEGCDKCHHFLLHKPSKSSPTINQVEETEVGSPISTSEEETVIKTVMKATKNHSINMWILPVILKGPAGMLSTFAMLDSGSNVTVIEEQVADQLGLKGKVTPFAVKGFQSSTTVPESRSVKVIVTSTTSDKKYKLERVKTVKHLDMPHQSVRKSLIDKWIHLHGIDLQPYENAKPTILIGDDNPSLHLSRETREGPGNAPIAARTDLGWILIGKVNWPTRQHFSFRITESIQDPLHDLVKRHFTVESFGVKINEKPRSREDKRAQTVLDATVRRVQDGWETGLLWRDTEVQLPESRTNAFRRLLTMERKMDKDAYFAQKYVEKIQEYIEKGYARMLTTEEAAMVTPTTYYLPHFMATNMKKPGKLRFVFDAASKSNGSSLNDHLVQGPDNMMPLPSVLFKFRQRRIGLTADIRDMFHRVKVRNEDASAQRFLWRGLDRSKEPNTYQMEVLIFGAACSPSCAQEVKDRNAMEFKEQYPEAYQAIVKRHYVDDFLDSCDSVEEAIIRFREVKIIQEMGGFHPVNWLCNNQEVIKAIPEEIRAKSMKSFDKEEDFEMERVLGLYWKPDTDKFTFNLTYLKAKKEILHGDRVPSKREVLSLVMSLFDPLGFLSLLTIKAKIILQATWRSGVDWNDEISPGVQDSWKSWLQELMKIPEFQLPRCYSSMLSSADQVQLHVFCDASEEAYSTVTYFRISKGQEIATAFVMGKSRVSPIKPLSIPRLELQAAVMGCRVAKFIMDEHEIKIDDIIYWTDSSNVLSWVKADGKRFHQFVSNRIGEIQEASDSNQWRWLPTTENVADEATRSNKPSNFTPSSRWVNGPPFLLQSEDHWPKKKQSIAIDEELEMKNSYVLRILESKPVMDISRFSSYNRMIRSTAWFLRFMNKIRKIPGELSKSISLDEIKNAEQWWWCKSQQSSFSDEYHALKHNLEISNSSKLIKLGVYMDDDGVMRARGRLQNAECLTANSKYPVILDPKHRFTKLLIHHFHVSCGHHGRERIVNEIRQDYYVIKIRSAVKSASVNCQQCKVTKVKPIVPRMANLPLFRLKSFVPPFYNCGLDYFGPIEILVRRSHEKRYCALFTCLSTRAIHLELAGSLSTDSCIMAIRRFAARRGYPNQIFSDNGTNFHGANNELRIALRELQQESLNDACSVKGTKWTFNPPAAPHMGGSWERMVSSVKVALGSALNQRTLREEVLVTLLAEAEHTVNSHPLTHVSDDPDDPEALTPNHFLIGRSSNLQQSGKFTFSDLTSRKCWRIAQFLSDHFWRRWIREYLPTLLRREKWNRVTAPIKEGDVVVEVNANLPRNTWPKGIVVKTYPGKDGIIRVVDVKMANSNVYRRPVSKLCILDVKKTEENDGSDI